MRAVGYTPPGLLQDVEEEALVGEATNASCSLVFNPLAAKWQGIDPVLSFDHSGAPLPTAAFKPACVVVDHDVFERQPHFACRSAGGRSALAHLHGQGSQLRD